MHWLSGFLFTIILLGAVQGFILSGLLFFSNRNRQQNRLLSALIFLIALASSKLYGAQQGWFNVFPLTIVEAFVPMIIVMPIGPLILFYVRSSLDPDLRLTKKDRIHFYPILIDLVPQLTAIVFVAGVSLHVFTNDSHPWGRFIDNYNVYSDIPRWASISFYLWMASRYLAGRITLPPAGRHITLPPAGHLKWLQQFIRAFLIFQCIWLIYLVPYVIPRYTDVVLNAVDWYPVYLPLAVLVYWLGIKGYIVSLQYPSKKGTANLSALPAAERERAIAALTHAMMADRLYLNPTLTVALLAQHTGLTQKTISAVLNQYMHKSFNEFVNEYRVGAMKEKLLQPETKNLTIAGLAYECGFNSLPTFQRAFKAVMGQTPKEFLSQNTNER